VVIAFEATEFDYI
jgi:hypothetical protein